MTERVLLRDEWDVRLAGTDLEPCLPFLPDGTRIIVVEDGPLLVGHWALVPYVHVEVLGIAEAHQGKAAVGRMLLRAMRREASEMGVHAVLTAALDDHVRQLITSAGGLQLPGTHHVIPIRDPRLREVQN